MKIISKLMIFMCLCLVLLLSGCFSTRTELFTIPLEESTYSMNTDEAVYFLEHQITRFDLTFIKTEDTTTKRTDYDPNLFGDFSYDEILIYEVILMVGIDGTDQVYDVLFKGAANPQRNNAYRFKVSVPEISIEHLHIVLDFSGTINVESLDLFRVQIKDFINKPVEAQDALFNIYKVNDNS